MIKQTIISILILTFISCGIKTVLLENKATRVPVKGSGFSIERKFDNSIWQQIDTLAVYKEISNTSGWYNSYKFYPNGCMNLFVIHGSEIPGPQYFDPQVNGYRGIYYIEKNKINGILYAETNQVGKIGRLKKEFIFSGDTLTINTKNGEMRYKTVCLRHKFHKEYFLFKADW